MATTDDHLMRIRKKRFDRKSSENPLPLLSARRAKAAKRLPGGRERRSGGRRGRGEEGYEVPNEGARAAREESDAHARWGVRASVKMMSAERNAVSLKLLVIGDANVGKSALMWRFTDGTFDGDYVSTVGMDFRATTISVGARAVRLQIWDTAGQGKRQSSSAS